MVALGHEALPDTKRQIQNQSDVKFCVPVHLPVLALLCYLMALIAVVKFQSSKAICIVHHISCSMCSCNMCGNLISLLFSPL